MRKWMSPNSVRFAGLSVGAALQPLAVFRQPKWWNAVSGRREVWLSLSGLSVSFDRSGLGLQATKRCCCPVFFCECNCKLQVLLLQVEVEI